MKQKAISKGGPCTGKQRTRLTLKDKRTVIAMRTLGESKETIEVKLNKKIKKNSMVLNLARESIKSADAKLKEFNRTHSKTDSPERKDFESKTLEKIEVNKNVTQPTISSFLKSMRTDCSSQQKKTIKLVFK